MNKWREFAELHGMTPQQFSDEVVECAQAVLAMKLVEDGVSEVNIINGQNDGVYQLNFKRIVK